MIKYTPRGMTLKFDFKNPQDISRGRFKDRVALQVMNENYFVVFDTKNKKTHKIQKRFLSNKVSLYKQLIKGQNEQTIQLNAEQASNSIIGLVMIQLFLSTFVNYSIEDLWRLFYMLQLVAFLSVYDTAAPSNVELYVAQFRVTLRFELLKPENIIKLFNSEFIMRDYLPETFPLSSSLESSG